MTADELEMYGLALFGSAWQAQLARELNVDRRRVKDWLNRESVPQFVDKEIKGVLYQRLSEVERAVRYYEEQNMRTLLDFYNDANSAFERSGFFESQKIEYDKTDPEMIFTGWADGDGIKLSDEQLKALLNAFEVEKAIFEEKGFVNENEFYDKAGRELDKITL